MDNELLKKVLTENQRIIIPGLGVFIRKEQDGVLIFNPFLKKDDGRLSAIVELEYGVATDEAKEIIEQYTEKVRTILKAKSRYQIEGIGSLVSDVNGVISFSAAPSAPATVEAPPATHQAPPMPPRPIAAPRPAEPSGSGQPFNQPQTNFRSQFSGTTTSIPQPIAQPRPAQSTAQQPIGQQPSFLQSSSMSPSSSPFSRPAPIPKPVIPGQPTPPQVTAPRPIKANTSSATPTPQSTRPTPPHAPTGPATRQQNAPRRAAAPRVLRTAKNSTKKGDMWLVIAIAAAAIVIVLMVVGIVNSSQLAELSLQ